MIDKKITAGVVLALIVESAGVFAWAGATGERLYQVEASVGAQGQLPERLARVEVKLDLATAQLIHIARKPEVR